MLGSEMKRRVKAPDGHGWVVQLVWWPRPGAMQEARDVRLGGVAFPLLIDAIHVFLWPLVLAFRVVLRRPWLVEAFRSDDDAEGAAWRVHGLAAGVPSNRRGTLRAVQGHGSRLRCRLRSPRSSGASERGDSRLRGTQPSPGPVFWNDP
jgi:hypothetical protein